MQNIDFSSRINRPSPFQAAHHLPSGGRERTGAAPVTDIKRRNRNLVFVLALLILAFTLGMMAGIQLGYLRHVDENLVTNPDPGPAGAVGDAARTAAGDSESFSNPGQAAGSEPASQDGRYLVKVGTFAPRAAELLAGRLNNHPDLAQAKPVRCKNVRESTPGRYLAFRVKLNDATDRQNVFLGCFASEDAAREALDLASASGIPGLSGARLYEIE
jgi:hypothetical protein